MEVGAKNAIAQTAGVAVVSFAVPSAVLLAGQGVGAVVLTTGIAAFGLASAPMLTGIGVLVAGGCVLKGVTTWGIRKALHRVPDKKIKLTLEVTPETA